MTAPRARPGPFDRLSEAMAPLAARLRVQMVDSERARAGPYIVQDLIGVGGMGLVYRARDERLGRPVALKFLWPHLCTDATAKRRFLNEARAAAALDHPNICTIHEVGETDDGHPFIAMALYDGETLQARLSRGRFSFAEAVPIVQQIARALARAHEHGIVHRDIKPSNVMLLPDGTVKILDFGIASMDGLVTGDDDALAGTIAYMSPEQVRGAEADHRSDIWSLGVLLHEMLTGVRPFQGDTRASVAGAIVSREPTLVTSTCRGVPAGIDRILRSALARRLEDRYASMPALLADLTALLAVTRIVDILSLLAPARRLVRADPEHRLRDDLVRQHRVRGMQAPEPRVAGGKALLDGSAVSRRE